jgi:hypothetical protein
MVRPGRALGSNCRKGNCSPIRSQQSSRRVGCIAIDERLIRVAVGATRMDTPPLGYRTYQRVRPLEQADGPRACRPTISYGISRMTVSTDAEARGRLTSSRSGREILAFSHQLPACHMFLHGGN